MRTVSWFGAAKPGRFVARALIPPTSSAATSTLASVDAEYDSPRDAQVLAYDRHGGQGPWRLTAVILPGRRFLSVDA
jgi:hypothetical protein